MKISKDNIIKLCIIFVLVMLMSYSFREIGLRLENIFLIFVLGVVITVVETKSFFMGLLLSVIYILSFNFFFTEPFYTLKMYDANYYVSFFIFMAVAFICSSLTIRLQNQRDISEYNQELSNKLYKIGHGFLNLSGLEETCFYAKKSLKELLGKDVKIILKNLKGKTEAENKYFQLILEGFYDKNIVTEDGEIIYPLKDKGEVLGILIIYSDNEKIKKDENLIIDTVISQTVITLQRELLTLENEEKNINIEREKLKTNLLRGISHDLRTPLTGIAGGANFLAENLDKLDKNTILQLLKDIESDSIWLSGIVENLLNMTKVQDGKLILNKKSEVIDDIVSDAISKVAKRKGDHKFIVNKPDKIILAPMDGQLIVQVLVNLIDNAFKHCKPMSTIELLVEENNKIIIFKVIDNGGGIKEKDINKVFENFYSADDKIPDKKRGMGLGLAICKAIVKAHNGTINVFNNEKGGATFTVTLPKGDK